MRWLVLVLMLLAVAAPGYAQKAADPRLAPHLTNALEALLALREAELAAVKEDTGKRIKDLEAICGEPCKPKAEAK